MAAGAAYDGSDLRLVSPSSDFATASTMHAFRNNSDEDVVLRSTNGGVSWDETSAEPFDDSAEDDEKIKTAIPTLRQHPGRRRQQGHHCHHHRRWQHLDQHRPRSPQQTGRSMS